MCVRFKSIKLIFFNDVILLLRAHFLFPLLSLFFIICVYLFSVCTTARRTTMMMMANFFLLMLYGVNDFGEMKQHDDHDDGGGEILYNILNAQIYLYTNRTETM